MRMTLTAAILLTLIGITGCPEAPEAVAPPVTSEQLTQMRQDFRREDRDARVGLVIDVLTANNLASVGSLTAADLRDFTVGDIITFVDSNGKVLTMGRVEAVNRSSLNVRYENPGPKGRAPVQGDAAVRAIH